MDESVQDPLSEYRRQQDERFARLQAEQSQRTPAIAGPAVEETVSQDVPVTADEPRSTLESDAAFARRLQEEYDGIRGSSSSNVEWLGDYQNQDEEVEVRPPMRTGYRERLIEEPESNIRFYDYFTRSQREERGDSVRGTVSNWCLRCMSSQHLRRAIVVGLGVTLVFILIQTFLAGLRVRPNPP
eukprot:Selendium_serpulae@DN6324_c0_g2_i2.p1